MSTIYFENNAICGKQILEVDIPVKTQMERKWKNFVFLSRLHFQTAKYSEIFKVLFYIFFKVPTSFNNLKTIRFVGCTQKKFYSIRIMKILQYAVSLRTLYLQMDKKKREYFFISLFNLVICRGKRKINLSIVDIGNNTIKSLKHPHRVGYLLQQVAQSCREWFVAYTYRRGNHLYLRKFLTAANEICKNNSSEKPKIYLGNYLLPRLDKAYQNYSKIRTAGGFELRRVLSVEEQEKSIIEIHD